MHPLKSIVVLALLALASLGFGAQTAFAASDDGVSPVNSYICQSVPPPGSGQVCTETTGIQFSQGTPSGIVTGFYIVSFTVTVYDTDGNVTFTSDGRTILDSVTNDGGGVVFNQHVTQTWTQGTQNCVSQFDLHVANGMTQYDNQSLSCR